MSGAAPGDNITGRQKNVKGSMAFWPDDAGDITTHAPRTFDFRDPTGTYADAHVVETRIADAREHPELTLETCGFELFQRGTLVSDFYNCEEVMSVYYEECRNFARELTGAELTFTFDHLIREPGRQISGGGTDGQTRITDAEAGGGYIGSVHMDYTDNTTWHEYLSLQDQEIPRNPSRVISLNFWRPLSAVIQDNPLAVCDATTISREDLFETVFYGYGADNYSCHDIGIETYNVKYRDQHRWYYYSEMTNEELLVIKSYDSRGVIGRASPHASFRLPDARGEPRRSIELRVLCVVS